MLKTFYLHSLKETSPKSLKELFTASEDEESDNQVLISAVERQDIFEAPKQPIVPGGDWLRNTLSSGDLDGMLKQVQSKTKVKEPHSKPSINVMTCAQCL